MGNWVRMEDYKVNNKASKDFGKPVTLKDPETGKLLCSDSIRRWYDVPHYKFFLDDPVSEANISGSDGSRGPPMAVSPTGTCIAWPRLTSCAPKPNIISTRPMERSKMT
ncbi:hypothetical protein KUH03_01325 [Sphingobacterium sp. E70]|uniref:hypothetical protein n=1 Tax=Sphingobacterium sp. E70 TaxID=2853439 RepID=UPI00211CCFCA|nr:hypothetical protein [Sphingobacterium sp. E70]ULT25677.1 hypothetical protein KUH03_01325 [Sphingobacterium sp. E70]